MSSTSEISKTEIEHDSPPKKANQFKGILWGVVYGLTATIYLLIPTKLIVTYWIPLNSFTIEGQEIYTVALLTLFLYIISLIISAIYVAAMFRAFLQRKNPDLGIPNGVQWVGAVTTISIIAFMIFWFFFTNGQIAFLSMEAPPLN
ncbi:MAG: hypothetical protein ACFFBP_10190 [Promethearchaeota archaeon]